MKWQPALAAGLSLAFCGLAVGLGTPLWALPGGAFGVLAVGLMWVNCVRLRRFSDQMSAQFVALLSNLQGGVEVARLEEDTSRLRLIYVSDGWEQMTGYTHAQVDELLGGDCLLAVHPRDRTQMRKTFLAQLHAGDCYCMEYRIVCRDGRVIWVLDRGKLLSREGGVQHLQSVLTDITELKNQQEQLSLHAERFRLTFECTDNALFEYDCRAGRYLDFTNSERLLGRTLEQINTDLTGTPPLSPGQVVPWDMLRYFYHPDDVRRVEEEMRRGWELGACSFLTRVLTADGGYVWCKIHLTVARDSDGQPYRVLGFVGNVDSVKRQSEVFRSKSEKDSLTGFYNQAAAMRRISEELAQNYQCSHALYVLDLDNFKHVNDTHGHIAGDAVLAGTAKRIRSLFRSGDILGRVGGDEFVVLVSGIDEREHVIKKAREIMAAVGQLCLPDGQEAQVTVSVGIHLPEQCPTSYESAFGQADKALYRAKRAGKNGFCFSDDPEPA